MLGVLGFNRVIGRSLERVNTSRTDEALLRGVEAQQFGKPTSNATTASANPPLYYLLQTPGALAGSQGSLLTRVMLMRLLSVVMFAGTVGFVFLFARELLPSSPWTWTAAGLAACFQPLLGFIGSGVNADGLVFLASSATFYCVARILNTSLTPRLGAALGAAVAVGMLTKPLFAALVPVALLGLAIAATRRPPSWRRSVGLALAAAVVPVVVAVVVGNAVFQHPYFAVTASVVSAQAGEAGQPSSLTRQASFMLQLFAPRLPFLSDQIPGVAPRDIWVSGLVGRFGWVDYGFGATATSIGWSLFLALLASVAAATVRFRIAVRQRWGIFPVLPHGARHRSRRYRRRRLSSVPRGRPALRTVAILATSNSSLRWSDRDRCPPRRTQRSRLSSLRSCWPGCRFTRSALCFSLLSGTIL